MASCLTVMWVVDRLVMTLRLGVFPFAHAPAPFVCALYEFRGAVLSYSEGAKSFCTSCKKGFDTAAWNTPKRTSVVVVVERF